MVKGLYTAYTGMVNEQNRMDIMTNNLANASTVGYKKEGSTSQSFNDVLTVKIKDQSVGMRNVQRIGIKNPGVKIGENYTDYTQGSFRITDNTYDLALAGDGFFAIEFTNKAGETDTKYTRAGQFTLNKDGYLVTEEGDYVLDTQNRRIRLNTLLDSKITCASAVVVLAPSMG
jgi:flagellar basal-body rod protein FlgF